MVSVAIWISSQVASDSLVWVGRNNIVENIAWNFSQGIREAVCQHILILQAWPFRKCSDGVLTSIHIKSFQINSYQFSQHCSSLMNEGAPAGQVVADVDPPVEVKAELLDLSDDEASAPAPEQALAEPKPSPSKGADLDPGLCRRKLSKIVWTVCPCARGRRRRTVNCFTQFRAETDVGALVTLYIRLRRLAKADMDTEVSSIN